MISPIVGLITRQPQKNADHFQQMVAALTKNVPGVNAKRFLSDAFRDEPNGIQFGTIGVGAENSVAQPGNLSHELTSQNVTASNAATSRPICVISEPNLAIVLDGYLQASCAEREHAALLQHKVAFRFRSDAELLLLMYREYGSDFLKKLDGAFALAIWDGRDQSVLLARDHLGQRPLLYYSDRERLLFAGELKAIRNVPDVPKTLNPIALQRYLFYQNVPEPLSIYDEIAKLEQGHYAVYRHGTLTLKRWWDYDFNFESPDVSLEQWQERIAETLPKPIATVFSGHSFGRTDGTQVSTGGTSTSHNAETSSPWVGTFLSGGVDSTIMTGLSVESAATKAATKSEIKPTSTNSNVHPVRTFSIGFQHDEYNEANVARNTATRLKTVHEEQIVGNHIVEILPQLAWYYDEPFADSSMIPVWFVMQLAAKAMPETLVTTVTGVPTISATETPQATSTKEMASIQASVLQTTRKNGVIFCGDGGDELFSGYLRHQAIALANRLDVIPKPLRRLIGGPIRQMIPAPTGQKSKVRRFKRFLEAIGYDSLERYSQWVTLFNKERLDLLLAPDLAATLKKENPLDRYEKIVALCSKRDTVTKFSIIDLLSGISSNAMVKVGVAASAFGVECRFPFLTREMVELAFQIPSKYKRRGKTGKLILRDTFRRFFSPELERHPKMGFGAPLDHWFRHGPLAEHAREVLTDPQTIARGYFRQSYVEQLLNEHQNSIFDHAYRLWALLMLEYWHQNASTHRASIGHLY